MSFLGQGILLVGMMSSTGVPVENLSYKKQRANVYQVTAIV